MSPMTAKKKSKVLIVDDDEDILLLLNHLLETDYEVVKASGGKGALKQVETYKPNLIVLDVMMPDMDGYTVCENLRKSKKFHNIPILFLTAKDTPFDRVYGLKKGGDDYLGKPFDNEEFVARVEALLRRARRIDEAPEKIVLGDLTIFPENYKVLIKKNQLELTVTEFNLILYFAQKPDKILTREQILNHVWGDTAVTDRTVDYHIKELRKKLGKFSHEINTQYGVGYSLVKSN